MDDAPVAQGIEQGLPKPRVGGSIPPRRTIKNTSIKYRVVILIAYLCEFITFQIGAIDRRIADER